MASSRAIVRVPASTANLGPGFDSLGMALNLFITIEIEVSDLTEIVLDGPNLLGIPMDETNLVYETAQSLFRAVGVHHPHLAIRMKSEIPLTRGLGSSAAAIVGALMAANHLAGDRLTRDELFQMATEMEQHPDNVGASLFGGFIVATWDGERAEHLRFDPHPNLGVMAVVPRFELPTREARSILPDQVRRQDAIFNLSHTGLLVAALVSGQLDSMQLAMRDRLHQPYRSKLIPGMDTVLRHAVEYGALGATLSGAGPTVLVFYKRDRKIGELHALVEHTFAKAGVDIDILSLEPYLGGAEII
jgi:homoserine kinase